MVDPNKPYQRNTLPDNSWNDLIRRINEKLADSEGCDELDPLEEVEECHRWNADDINTVQEKLEESCDDISLERVNPCDKWKKKYIDDIEAEIDNIYCDCDDDGCIYPCENAGDRVEIPLGTTIAEGCHSHAQNSLTFCAAGRQEIDDLFDEIDDAFVALNDAYADFCESSHKLMKLESQLVSLETARDSACSPGPSQACTDAQAAVDQKQTEVDDEQAIKDAAAAEVFAQSSIMEAKAPVSMAKALTVARPETIVYAEPPSGHPWTNLVCEDNAPKCAGWFAGRCEKQWYIQSRRIQDYYENMNPASGNFGQVIVNNTPLPWGTGAQGYYTPQGLPYVESIVFCFGSNDYYYLDSTTSFIMNGCLWITGDPYDTLFTSRRTVEHRLLIVPPTDFSPRSCKGCDCDDDGIIEGTCPGDQGEGGGETGGDG